MKKEDLEARVRVLRKSKQYKKKTTEEIVQLVRNQLLQKEISIADMFQDEDEKTAAKELTKKYLAEYIPETVSDTNNLRSLIYLEIIQERLQTVLNNLSVGGKAIPINLVDSIHKNLREITAQKERLGLIGKEKEENKSDAYKALELVRSKFKKWLEDNQGTREMVCPHCGQMTMLRMRMDRWEVQKHPFFRDRWLTSKHLMQMYVDGKIDVSDVAKVLEVSDDYITNWLLDRWKDNEDYQEMTGKSNKEQKNSEGEKGSSPVSA